MGSAVESKFERVGMARWFGHAESIDGLLNLWSGRLCILFHYLIMTGMPLEEHACQTRTKAPQIHLLRDIHTLTTFWCYRLFFVAESNLACGSELCSCRITLITSTFCSWGLWARPPVLSLVPLQAYDNPPKNTCQKLPYNTEFKNH